MDQVSLAPNLDQMDNQSISNIRVVHGRLLNSVRFRLGNSRVLFKGLPITRILTFIWQSVSHTIASWSNAANQSQMRSNSTKLDSNHDDLLRRYLRTCWIIKIRMMSARRQLWGELVSLIHLENAYVQLRKVCEGTANLALIAGEIEFGDLPRKLRKKNEVGLILKHLKKIDRLKFPSRASLKAKKNEGENTVWELKFSDSDMASDLDRVIAIWNRTGYFLHEKSAFKEWPGQRGEAISSLCNDLDAARSDHHFLWHYLWLHSMRLTKTEVFLLNMLEDQKPSRPQMVSMEGFVKGDIGFEFEPDFFADFHGDIDWTAYSNAKDTNTNPKVPQDAVNPHRP